MKHLLFLKLKVAVVAFVLIVGCATTTSIQKWERTGNVAKLSQVAQNKYEPPSIRKKSLESLARLNWKPSNSERLQVYATFASPENYAEAELLMQILPAEHFAEIDKAVVDCAALLTEAGRWRDRGAGRIRYDHLLSLDKKAVTMSLCHQVAARPKMQTRLVLLGIKLGITGSEDELVDVLLEYGDKTMAEDYLNSGSVTLADGARKWAAANGYNVTKGFGSSRSRWGAF